jgi:hypothetical protein
VVCNADIQVRTASFTQKAGSALGSTNSTAGTGLPILLDTKYPLKMLSFVMRYDTSVMTVTRVVAGANLPADAQLDFVVISPGLVRVTLNCRSKNIAVGTGLELVKLQGSVASNAPVGKKSLLDLTLNNVVGTGGQSYSTQLGAIDGAMTIGSA